MTYGPTFDDALRQMLDGQAPLPPETAPDAITTDGGAPPPPATDRDALIARASLALEDYQQLTAAGRLADAGRKLEELRETLNALNP